VAAPAGSREDLARRAEQDRLPALAPEAHARVVVWGDSFATTWQPLGLAIAHAQHSGSRLLNLQGCPPLLGLQVKDFRHIVDPAECLAHNRDALQIARAADTVVLAFYWQRYTGSGRDPEVEDDLRATLQGLRGVRQVLVLAPTPVMRDAVPRCIRAGVDCGISRMSFELEARPLRALLARASAGLANVRVVDPSPELCSLARCTGLRDGVALYSDDHHVSGTAARAFSAHWVAANATGKPNPASP
jgi:hypothetical protein